MTSYIGRSKEGTSPLRGQIEMLAYSSSYLILDTNSNYLDYINITSSTNEFDQLGLLKKNSITRYGKSLISSKYEYFEEPDGDNIRVIPDVKNLRLYYKNKTNENIVDIQNLYSYGYDAKGNIDKVSIDGTLKFRYSYDSLSRLKEESYTQQSEPDIVYTYDSNGNIKSKDYKNKGYSHEYKYSFNSKDILNSINKVTIENNIVETEVIKRFEYYDTLYTNPTFCGTGSGEDKKGIFYTWEGRRLVNYYDNISFTNIEYKYDSQSRRTAKTVTDKSNKDDVKISEVSYLYDGDKLLSEIDIINNKNKYFTYDENGKLISIRYNGRSYYYMRELTGNIIGLVDDSGVVVVRYEYDAYGNILSVNDTSNINIGNENPFKYKGYYYDIETSMYYCKTRYYVPEWGRWLNADSVKYLDPKTLNGLNLFSYCGNNPIMRSDITGRSWNSFWNDVGTFFDENRDIILGVSLTVGAAALSIATFGLGTVVVGVVAGAVIGSGFGALNALANGDNVLYGVVSGALVGGLSGLGGFSGGLATGIGAYTLSLIGDKINGREKDPNKAFATGVTAFIFSRLSYKAGSVLGPNTDPMAVQVIGNSLGSFIFSAYNFIADVFVDLFD